MSYLRGMTEPTILLSIDPVQATAKGLDEPAAIARLTINRANKSNALNQATMVAFVEAVEQAAADPSVRALIVTGAGDRAFVGGADIREMGDLNPESARQFITTVHRCCDAVRRFPAPVIARINGVAFGAGLELAAACDMRVAVDDAVLGMPEVRLGIPSVVEAALLPGLIGWGRNLRHGASRAMGAAEQRRAARRTRSTSAALGGFSAGQRTGLGTRSESLDHRLGNLAVA